MTDRFKFRAWDLKNKAYIGLDYGESFDYIDEFYGDCELYRLNGPKSISDETISYDCSDKRYIVEQCTGLKDKNGKLIYEGDIVTDGEYNGLVFWKNSGWACTMFLWHKKTEELEVIGNIIENKDLLEG